MAKESIRMVIEAVCIYRQKANCYKSTSLLPIHQGTIHSALTPVCHLASIGDDYDLIRKLSITCVLSVGRKHESLDALRDYYFEKWTSLRSKQPPKEACLGKWEGNSSFCPLGYAY